MISKYPRFIGILSVVFIMALTGTCTCVSCAGSTGAGTARVRAESHLKEKSEFVRKGLILDLDADRGVKVVNGRVTSWKNQVDWKVKTFAATRDSSHKNGTGHPALKEKVAAIGGHNAVILYCFN